MLSTMGMSIHSTKRKIHHSGVMYWQCKDKQTLQCKARLYTQEKTSVIRVTENSHPPSATHIETLMVVSKIKNDSSTKLPRQVVRDVLVEISVDVKVALPTCTNLKVQIRRYRRKINNVPVNPQNAALRLIPPGYRITTKGDEFLLQHSITEAGKRILIFGSNLVLGATNSHIDALFVDGTFTSCSVLFKQVWIIRVNKSGLNILILYALLEDMTSTSYKTVLQFLKTDVPTFPQLSSYLTSNRQKFRR